ncbi:MAG: endonuclease [Bacteroidetes bacterium]|nr:endonuclease [Bacteroidota bacterium]
MSNFASRDTVNSQRVVTCVYSGHQYVYSGTFTWAVFSREHTWCHSWMPSNPGEASDEYADQHHLFPTHQNNANSRRSNHPLGIVTTASYTYLQGKLGTNSSGETVYEPRDEHKGDAARALLYMSVRYDGIGGYNWTFNNLNNVILPGQGVPEAPQSLQLLLDWHKQDPPTKWEVDRNNYIESIQQNRNPFTDHPEYVDHINFNDLTKLTPSYSTEPSNQPTNLSVTSPSSTSLSVSWTASVAGAQAPSGYLVEIYNTNDYFIPIDGSSYTDDTDIADSKGLKNVTSGTSHTFTGLTPSTTYYVRVYPYNGSTTAVNYKLNGTVISGSGATGVASPYAVEPSNHPTNFAQGTVTTSSVQVTWTASVAGAQAPSGYLLKASTVNTFSDPVDGEVYADDAVLSDNSAVVNLSSSDVSYTFSSLPASTTYYFKIFPYNGNSTERNYKTDGTVSTVTGVTSTPSLASEPSHHPRGFGYFDPTITENSITVRWQDTTGVVLPSGYIILAGTNGSFTDPVDATEYANDTVLSDGSAKVHVSYAAADTFRFTGLTAATSYYFKIFAYNGDGTLRNYKTDNFPVNTGYIMYTTSGPGTPVTSVVVNEYMNGAAQSTEWVELLVQQDDLDMRGMLLRDYSTSGSTQSGLTFGNHALWSSVPRGAFIVVLGNTNPQTEDLSFTGDNVVIVSGTNPNYFSGSTFNIGGSNDAVEILTSGSTHIHSLSHGSKPGNIGTLGAPTANSSSAPASGSVVRFINVSSSEHFGQDANTGTSVTSTQGAANDATQQSYISNVLPVELTSFTAVQRGSSVELLWNTATERNNLGFEIQRSESDVRQQTAESFPWRTIGFVDGHGSSNSSHEYRYYDRSVRAQRNFYRLKQIDRDGHFEYSQSVEVTVSGQLRSFTLLHVHPNPFNPSTNVTVEIPAALHGLPAQLDVVDVMGRVVATLHHSPLAAGTHQFRFNGTSLASGAYLCRFRIGTEQQLVRLLLMK